MRINRRRVVRPDVSYIVADFLVWQPDRRYDTVFFSFWLSHMAATPSIRAIEIKLSQGAKPGLPCSPSVASRPSVATPAAALPASPPGHDGCSMASTRPWKSVRCANYLAALRFELLCLARACGYLHPALVPLDAIELLDVDLKTVRADELLDYQPDWGRPGPADVEAITTLMGNLCGQ